MKTMQQTKISIEKLSAGIKTEDEKELKALFNSRYATISMKSKLTKRDKIELWERLLKHYKTGFYCEYCDNLLTIHRNKINTFSFEHRNNYHSEFNINEILIVCSGCNFFKRNMSERNFRLLISLFRKNGCMRAFNEMKEEIMSGIYRGKEHAKANGKVCNRPRKEINIVKVKELYARGITLKRIADREGISYSTLRSRLREGNTLLEPEMQKENTTISDYCL